MNSPVVIIFLNTCYCLWREKSTSCQVIGICGPQKCCRALGLLEASWTFDTLEKMAVTCPLSSVFILISAIGWEEKEPSGKFCMSRKCKPWWGSHFLANIHIYPFFIHSVRNALHLVAAQRKKIPQGPWYPWALVAPGTHASFWMWFVHFVIGLLIQQWL